MTGIVWCFLQADCESELMTSYSDHRPTFVFNNLCGEQEDLIPKGSRVAVTLVYHLHVLKSPELVMFVNVVLIMFLASYST